MALTSGQITTLLALQKPKVCAYWKVYWDFGNTAEDRYYSDSVYNEMSGFLGIGLDIEAQILNNVWLDTQFELNPDIKSEKITIRFNDIAVDGVKPISSRFQEFKSGVKCELFYYYADLDEHVSKWTGQLQAPDVYGHDSVEAVATNGFRSREQQIPKRTRPRECTADFGGMQPDHPEIVRTGLGSLHHIDAAQLAEFGQVVGTLAFMPPERRERLFAGDSLPPDPRADLYALSLSLIVVLGVEGMDAPIPDDIARDPRLAGHGTGHHV